MEMEFDAPSGFKITSGLNDMKRKQPIYHLLIKGEFKIHCLPNSPAGNFNVTNQPSKANCANCLTKFRYKPGAIGRTSRFKVKHTNRYNP